MEIVNSNSPKLIKIYDNEGNLTEQGENYRKLGLSTLSQNKFGVVILSGGQGTRLGCDGPKGLFKICGLTLFEHHIKNIKSKEYSNMIKLFIMTSDNTHEDVVAYFKSNNNFQLDVVFFKQTSLTCTYENDEVIKINDMVLTAPNGNGDIFNSINKIDLHDIYAINVISVDNILAEILNPEFIGAFIEKKLDILSKSVKKLPNENVGIFTLNNGKIEVKEYSEMDNKEDYECEGNICNHLFRTDFIKSMRDKKLPIHKAIKKIPKNIRDQINKPEEVICIKKECFIFDAFLFTEKNMVMSVPRDKEFAPLKNSMTSSSDNPETCTNAYKQKYQKN
ncbi:putative uridylyltransferase [Vairimorpha necatrix]|uniref:UDP-N-acetylglucosamine diphosphorylase n=1 Tax=Vairimorpha necatrix TaxID=6039 RepID=A0AAX4JGD6_9MICR